MDFFCCCSRNQTQAIPKWKKNDHQAIKTNLIGLSEKEQKQQHDIRKYLAEIILSKRAEKKIRNQSFNYETSSLFLRRSINRQIALTVENIEILNTNEEQNFYEDGIVSYRSLPSTILDSESDENSEQNEKNFEEEQGEMLGELQNAQSIQNNANSAINSSEQDV